MKQPQKKRQDSLTIYSSKLSKWDRKYVWHPFTQMQEWEKEAPLIIERGDGIYLYDVHGNKYLDGSSSIWVNLHGHRHRTLDRAIQKQLDKIAHSTLLGAASPPSILLAKELVNIAPKGLTRVFYSDDGATAVEVALKMAIQYWQQQSPPQKKKKTFVRLDAAYHGDTMGSMSVGGTARFHERFRPLLFSTIALDAPYCYRCPLDLHFPSCRTACLDPLEDVLSKRHERIAGVVIEPMVQAVAGMITQPHGYLSRIQALCSQYNVLLIADEVATGFGRTGKMFACDHERVTPDLVCVAKGLTGGYLPLAATLTTERIYEAFLGEPEKTFFHGHSYTGNALGCAAALANLEIFKKEKTLAHVRKQSGLLQALLKPLAELPIVGDVRQCGMMAGIELVKNKETREPFPLTERKGHMIAAECRRRGLLIRPIGNIVVLVPPLAATEVELRKMSSILTKACCIAYRTISS
ncbi:MAG: adenosylmethionine--8-amino-7-oxononanoate transaminase [Nitrospira sp. SB0677_bin_15]|nr:adenosylmethionine--8-amino-7-oxononanoate transaminase [Nitrospira sp. SB0667_bin_9]MYD31355.1 adenosylmethionine--8-amino-7-oxononanoate transaminase [Nitrospira sp. SB0661_bin_20]MYG40066.1 adenosylmethionine--8-amino-7-oxononanoate transaminase [Nitrospira sp. SB0677_bin_15]MYH02854.1 adenosylmethionine--8-amino-7-oxononanoate transaminase [Nitrospira sp. SB0675_bin_23]MYJ22216.1 adenosylmethionine--8-amino-7-oxononanoate transaminase [Nitrospira sp. SB0673_bin_12]